MAASVLVDAGFVVALLSRRDAHHPWAVAKTANLAPPWSTCEAALSEAFHLLGARGGAALEGGGGRGWGEKCPDEDPKSVNFVDLRNWVLALPGFSDDPKRSGEKILEAIQLAWIDEAG